MISIHETRVGRLEVPTFSHEQLEEIGQTAIGCESARLAQALNINDQPARPLVPKYAKAKLKKGGRPVRDLRLSGSMLGSRDVVDVQDKSVTVGFTDQAQTSKAAINEAREQMLGPSIADQLQIGNRAHEIFAGNVRKLGA